MEEKQPVQLGQGYFWDEIAVGDRFATQRRTVTEADLVAFISATGMLESIFIDQSYEGAIPGRPVPGALTHCFIEGMILQTMVQRTGLALLELTIRPLAPVRVGDSISATVEVTEVRPTSGGCGVVRSLNTVINQHGETVMTYEAVRLLAGRNKEVQP